MSELDRYKSLENRFKLIQANDTFNSLFERIPDVSDYLKAKVFKKFTEMHQSGTSFKTKDEIEDFARCMNWAFNFEAYPYILGVLDTDVSNFNVDEYYSKLIEYHKVQTFKDKYPYTKTDNVKDPKYARLFEELDPNRPFNGVQTILTLIAVNRLDQFMADAKANNRFERVKAKPGQLDYKLKNKYYIEVLNLVKEKLLSGSFKVKTHMVDALFRTPEDNIALNIVKYNSIDNVKKYRSSFPQLETIGKELIAESAKLKDTVQIDEKQLIADSGTSIKDVYVLAKYNANTLVGLQTEAVYNDRPTADMVRDAQPKGTAFKYNVMSLSEFMEAQKALYLSNQVEATPGM